MEGAKIPGGSIGDAPPPTALINTAVQDPALTRLAEQGIAPHVAALLRGLKKRDGMRKREGIVTVEEFVKEEGSRIGKK